MAISSSMVLVLVGLIDQFEICVYDKRPRPEEEGEARERHTIGGWTLDRHVGLLFGASTNRPTVPSDSVNRVSIGCQTVQNGVNRVLDGCRTAFFLL